MNHSDGPQVSDIEISGMDNQISGNLGGKDRLHEPLNPGDISDLEKAEYVLINQRVEFCEWIPMIEVAN